MASSNRSVSLVVIVISLLVAGGLLFAAVRELSAELEHDERYGGAFSAIHLAAEKGDAAAVRRELEKGVDVDVRRDGGDPWQQGMTPLMSAIISQDLDTAKLLLEKGAKADAASKDGRTALIYAAGWAGADMVDLLLEQSPPLDARSSDGWTALMMASGARGEAESVRRLLARGANVDYRNKWGQTALHLAAVAGSADKVRLLLEAGAQVNDRDNDGRTPIVIASANEAELAVLDALIAAGADVNIPDNDGLTPLMRAADRGDVERVLVLLNAGADPRAVDNTGRTAKGWADNRADDRGREIVAILESAA